jgi:hypothetical protein
MLYRTLDTFEPMYRTLADIKVKTLTERYIQNYEYHLLQESSEGL